jgi:isocitrate/isopropylmalate dehydrogenase
MVALFRGLIQNITKIAKAGPHDGIGVEVADQAIRVIDKLNEQGLNATYEKELVGGASYDANGEPLTLEVLEKAKQSVYGEALGSRSIRVRHDVRQRHLFDFGETGHLRGVVRQDGLT